MSPSELQGKKATVVGGARSGLAAARLLARHGAAVFLTEQGDGSKEAAAALDEAGVPYETIFVDIRNGGSKTPEFKAITKLVR